MQGSEPNNHRDSESFELMKLFIFSLKPRKARLQKIAVFIFASPTAPRNFAELTFVACQRKHFQVCLANFFDAELIQKKRSFDTQEFTGLLSTGVVTVSSHAP